MWCKSRRTVSTAVCRGPYPANYRHCSVFLWEARNSWNDTVAYMHSEILSPRRSPKANKAHSTERTTDSTDHKRSIIAQTNDLHSRTTKPARPDGHSRHLFTVRTGKQTGSPAPDLTVR